MQNPKVFISHARKDKERFVLDFAEKLRAKGIDAWMDKWEMLPGDSLIGKIFEEGIGNAQAFIVVLSKNSIKSKWVKEELNAGMVKKIEKGSRLIPVVIDITDEQVPECLKSTLWERIEDINNYENELDRIVNAIYGHREKPPLGKPPGYTKIDSVPSLEQSDSLVLKLASAKSIKDGFFDNIEAKEILESARPWGIDEECLWESLQVLENRRYIDLHQDMGFDHRGLEVVCFRVTTLGFENFLRTYFENYGSIYKLVVSRIINHNEWNNISVAQSIDKPLIIVDHILEELHNKRLIHRERVGQGRIDIMRVNPELKRWLRQA